MEILLDDVEKTLCAVLDAPITDVEPLAGGHWSKAFGFRAGGRDLVARFGAHVADFHRDRAAVQFGGPDMPVPEVLQIGEAFGGYYCVSERMFGEMIDDLPAERMQPIVPGVLRLMDVLRGVDLQRWIADLQIKATPWREQLLKVDQENERVHGWHDRLEGFPLGTEAYSLAWRYLNEHLDVCPDANALVHNDLFHQKVLVQGDRISGVLDWGNAMPGDFLYELALVDFYAPWFPSMEGIDWVREAREHYERIGLEVPNMDERLRCYWMHVGLDGMAYNAFREDWAAVEAAARRTLELASFGDQRWMLAD